MFSCICKLRFRYMHGCIYVDLWVFNNDKELAFINEYLRSTFHEKDEKENGEVNKMSSTYRKIG